MESVKTVLMRRDKISADEADELIEEFKADLQVLMEDGANLEDAYDLVEDFFGLEPDYLEEFLF